MREGRIINMKKNYMEPIAEFQKWNSMDVITASNPISFTYQDNKGDVDSVDDGFNFGDL